MTTSADALDARCRRILPPRGLLLGLVLQLPLLVLAWPLHPPALSVLAGALFVVTGAVLNVWADALFKRNRIGVCPFSPAPSLLAGGPYRVTRNPMYAGMFLLCAAPALLAGVPANLAVPVLFAIWLDRCYVRPEEAYLRRLFGEAFDGYARRTPRWLV